MGSWLDLDSSGLAHGDELGRGVGWAVFTRRGVERWAGMGGIGEEEVWKSGRLLVVWERCVLCSGS